MLKNKIKYILVIFILISPVLIVTAERLNDPRENRDCYKGNLPFFVCVIENTMIMEKSFMTYDEMHEYYTPQLKEVNMSVGQTQTLTIKKIGALSITGSPSYLYTKRQ